VANWGVTTEVISIVGTNNIKKSPLNLGIPETSTCSPVPYRKKKVKKKNKKTK